MNRYIVQKIVFANNIQEVIDIETGIISQIILQEDITHPNEMGFINKNGQRNKMVSPIRKRG